MPFGNFSNGLRRLQLFRSHVLKGRIRRFREIGHFLTQQNDQVVERNNSDHIPFFIDDRNSADSLIFHLTNDIIDPVGFLHSLDRLTHDLLNSAVVHVHVLSNTTDDNISVSENPLWFVLVANQNGANISFAHDASDFSDLSVGLYANHLPVDDIFQHDEMRCIACARSIKPLSSELMPKATFGPKIRAVIFDLDGTLIDTEPAAARAITETFQQWGIQVTHDDSTFITGRTWETAFQYLFKKYELPVPAQHASRLMIERYRDLVTNELFPVKGSAEAVKALAKEYPLGLVSGSYRSEILWALDRLGVRELFQVILGAEDYPRSKPAPDGYLKALDMMNVKGEQTLVFEDSEPGIAAAKAAGTYVAAITGTNHFRHDHSAADLTVPDLSCVSPEWLKKLA